MKQLIISFFILLHSSLICAQTANYVNLISSVDSLLTTQFKSNEPGVSVLIAKKNEIVYKNAFGSANVELDVAMQPDMLFRIGSITKTVYSHWYFTIS
jgi:CubicO group peptidase (beta-lactamase class C family)